MSDDRSRAMIAPYLAQPVAVACDGVIFDDGPKTFSLRFVDPAALREQLGEDFSDEMDMEPWSELVPVAAVRGPEYPKEMAWVFLDWSDDEDAPSVKVATHDNWSGDLMLPSLAALLAGESAAGDEDDGDDEAEAEDD